jgi:osmotically-inducible protein OsmY
MPPTAISPARSTHLEESRTRDEASTLRYARSGASHRPASPSRRLHDLQQRVVDALVNSGYAALAYVRCEVDNGRVILRGSVLSYHLKQQAQVHALRVDGVGRVENRLEVRGRGPC